jgi:hypothetical protein
VGLDVLGLALHPGRELLAMVREPRGCRRALDRELLPERSAVPCRLLLDGCLWVRLFCNGEKLIDSARLIAMELFGSLASGPRLEHAASRHI